MPARKKEAPEPTAREQKIARGEQAKRLLDDPLFQEAFGTLETHYAEAWRASDPTEANRREQMYLSLKCLAEVKLELELAVTGGKLAKKQ